MTFTITYADPLDGRIVRRDELDADTLTHAAAHAEMHCPKSWVIASVEREMRIVSDIDREYDAALSEFSRNAA